MLEYEFKYIENIFAEDEGDGTRMARIERMNTDII